MLHFRANACTGPVLFELCVMEKEQKNSKFSHLIFLMMKKVSRSRFCLKVFALPTVVIVELQDTIFNLLIAAGICSENIYVRS